jgi:hypothetical protein
MPEITMHEHVAYGLPPMIKWRGRIEKCELFKHELPVERYHYHDQGIDNDNVLYCLRDVAQKASPVFV